MKTKRKSQIDLIVTITLLLAGFFVVGEIVRDKFLSDAEIRTKESACKTANMIAQKTDLSSIQEAGLNLCTTIPLGGLPRKGYPPTISGVSKNIADKIAKAWEIWLEGTKADYFGTSTWAGKQKCFVQYTFKIKKERGLDPITRPEFLRYLSETVYKVVDASDSCMGTNGGTCKTACEPGEIEVKKPAKQCIGNKNLCCVNDDECASKGGVCVGGERSEEEAKIVAGMLRYPKWKCKDRNQACYVYEKNYITYSKYISTNTGLIGIYADKLYPQEYEEIDGTKISETYAIAFASSTHAEIIKWRTAAGITGVAWWIGGPAAGLVAGAGAGIAKGIDAVSNWYTEDENINRIIIAPLNEISNICHVQSGTTA